MSQFPTVSPELQQRPQVAGPQAPQGSKTQAKQLLFRRDHQQASNLSANQSHDVANDWDQTGNREVQAQHTRWYNRAWAVRIGYALQGLCGWAAARSIYHRVRGNNTDREGLMRIQYDPTLSAPGSKPAQRTYEQARIANRSALFGMNIIGIAPAIVLGIGAAICAACQNLKRSRNPEPMEWLVNEFRGRDINVNSVTAVYRQNLNGLADYLCAQGIRSVADGLAMAKQLSKTACDDDPKCVRIIAAFRKHFFEAEFSMENCDFDLAVALLRRLHPMNGSSEMDVAFETEDDFQYMLNRFIRLSPDRSVISNRDIVIDKDWVNNSAININSKNHQRLLKFANPQGFSARFYDFYRTLRDSTSGKPPVTNRESPKFLKLDPNITALLPSRDVSPSLHIADIFHTARGEASSLVRHGFVRFASQIRNWDT